MILFYYQKQCLVFCCDLSTYILLKSVHVAYAKTIIIFARNYTSLSHCRLLNFLVEICWNKSRVIKALRRFIFQSSWNITETFAFFIATIILRFLSRIEPIEILRFQSRIEPIDCIIMEMSCIRMRRTWSQLHFFLSPRRKIENNTLHRDTFSFRCKSRFATAKATKKGYMINF